MKIAMRIAVSALIGVFFVGLLLFWPAGTFNYWQAWVFIAVFAVGTVIPSIYLAVTKPATLQRRMRAGPAAETRGIQKLAISSTGLVFAAALVVSGLDHRFGWSPVSTVIVVLGDVLLAAGLMASQYVVFQNSYAAATITVEAGQTLVTTGLYGFVRHPMYFASTVMMIGVPLALGSYWALLVVLPGIAILALRILDEEALLRAELDGYPEYTEHVRYRLMPGVW